uniref:Uncharacterized protein n=1 Tax=Alexandrium andersonii TaxID=327968 RepID=A0A7S2C2T0_9DINO|mmetsp:Transcript_3315/g.7502  ORF Transcript_3315/g.7502 Transcript_3315/m.7502 type:complete len:151 (+) Transcript_3315:339-791(+)
MVALGHHTCPTCRRDTQWKVPLDPKGYFHISNAMDLDGNPAIVSMHAEAEDLAMQEDPGAAPSPADTEIDSNPDVINEIRLRIRQRRQTLGIEMGEDCAAPPTPAPQGQLPRQRAFFENSFGQRIPVMFLSGTGPCSNPSCFACVERKGQ